MVFDPSRVDCWIFDLDYTLYPPACGLFGQIDRRMGLFIANLLSCDAQEARRVQKMYFHDHGTTLAGLVVFRVIWGFVGTRNARFSSFVRGPRAVLRYLKAMTTSQPEHHTGHNPAGALAIMAMLTLAVAVTASGWAVYSDIGGDVLEGLHEFAANTMLAVVGMHIAGVLFASWQGHENLIASMVTGRKDGRPEDGVRRAWTTVAALMLIAVAAFWWTQWQSAPASGGLNERQIVGQIRSGNGDED
jgi:cytochrome b